MEEEEEEGGGMRRRNGGKITFYGSRAIAVYIEW